MKGKLTTKFDGFSTLEMLIAMALLVLSISAAVLVSFGNQSLSIDSQTESEAVSKARAGLEQARASSTVDFGSISTTVPEGDDIYTKQTVVDSGTATNCGAKVSSNVSWTSDKGHSQSVSLSTYLSDFIEVQALGGNCDFSAPTGNWKVPTTFATYNFNPGKPTGLDVFKKIVYMTANKSPYLFIADTSSATLGQNNELFVNFANSFDAGVVLNDIRVARFSDSNIYAFVARNSNTSQFQVIKVTDKKNPVSIGTFQLSGVSSSGSFPQAWRVYYFNGRAYVLTRFTAGPELHIFNVATPWDPATITEIGSGIELGRTVEGLLVKKQFLSGSWHYIAYMATDKNTAPLSIYDVTNPSAVVEKTSVEPVFANYQDGETVFALGNKLYFGRDSDPAGDDLFIYDISNPLSNAPLPLLGSKDIGITVLGIGVSGNFSFIATSKVNKEFQVWPSDPTTGNSAIAVFNFSNIINNGVKYEDNWVYVSSQASGALRVIYSP